MRKWILAAALAAVAGSALAQAKYPNRPVEVVGVIGPWNYPLTNNFGDAIPALAAGNAEPFLQPSYERSSS